MNASISFSSLAAPITRFLSKYHATIYFTIIVLLLAAAILSLFLTSQKASIADNSSETTVSSSFDQTTADQIQQLRESDESATDLDFPSPRSNPFVE